MEDLIGVAFWMVGFLLAIPVIMGLLGGVGAIAHGIVWLASRVPGLRRCVCALERREPGTPTGLVFLTLVLGFLVTLWTGWLGRLIVWFRTG